MSSVKCEKICEPLMLGEGPHWDDKENVLYFVGMPDKNICKYDPKTQKITSAFIDGEGDPSIIIPVSGQKNKFLSTIGREVCVLTWDGQSTKPENVEVFATLGNEYGVRINDGKVDACGRLWSGTMGQLDGEIFAHRNNIFYSIGRDRKLKIWNKNIALSNGMGWSPDNTLMYYIDTLTYAVNVFDFNLETGDIANRRTVIDFKKEGIEGLPDGMTVDQNGNIWVAVFYGKQVIQVDPSSGKVLRSVPIPAPNVTSVAFGGLNLDELFVTSAYMMMKTEERKESPQSGCTFRVTGLGVKGVPAGTFTL